MSRGLGRLEQIVVAMLARDGHWRRRNLSAPLFVDARGIATAAYRGDANPWEPTRSQLAAASRAIRTVVRKHPDLFATGGGKGSGPGGWLYVYPLDDPASVRWAEEEEAAKERMRGWRPSRVRRLSSAAGAAVGPGPAGRDVRV